MTKIKKIVFLAFLMINIAFLSNEWIYNESGKGIIKREPPFVEQEALKTSPETSWVANGALICNADGTQRNTDVCSDGEGGAFIVWEDRRSGSMWQIYAQKISSTGQILWGINGTVICLTNGGFPQICSDTQGGAIITWGSGNIYVQKVNSNGQIQWIDGGVLICGASEVQDGPQICSVGSGEFVITWMDYRNLTPSLQADIYAQKIDSNGNTKWTNDGIEVCTAERAQYYQKICKDEEGGVFITWEDYRSGNYDIYIQNINSNGYPQWVSNGLPLCRLSGNQHSPDIISDGNGGAIVSWTDKRYTIEDLYAQKVDSTGTKWTNNGVVVCLAIDEQTNPKLCSDQSGGAIISWYDYRDFNYDIYAQRINSIGNIVWNVWGVPVCTASDIQWSQEIISDQSGGAIISWYDKRNNNYDIYAQRLDSTGQSKWVNNGVPVCNAVGDQSDPKICSDGVNGAIIVWEDERNNVEDDIYAQRITNRLPESTHPEDILTTVSGTETIQWTLTDDSGSGQYRVIANTSVGNNYIWVDWTPWTNNSVITVPINRTRPGFYNYTIEFYDDQNRLGIPDTSLIEILDAIPVSTNPKDLITAPGRPEVITWTLFDDFGGGQYRVIANTSVGNSYTWVDWAPWTNNSAIIVPINHTNLGIYNYTIEFFDDEIQFGVHDTVIVTILDATDFPNITINSPYSSQVFGNLTLGFDLTIIEDDLDTTWYTLNNGMKHQFLGTTGIIDQAVWDLFDDGVVSVMFYANNTAGYLDYKEVIIYKDGKAPEIIIHSPKPNQFYGILTAEFNLTIIEPTLNTTWYMVGGNNSKYFFTGTSGIIDQAIWDSSDEGPVLIKFYANSSLGNNASKEITIFKDSIIPEILIISPTPNQLFGNSTFSFDLIIVEDNINTSWYTLNDGIEHQFLGNSGTVNQAVWDLCDNGTISIKFCVNDSAGALAYDEISIRKDSIGPEISILNPVEYQLCGPILNFSLTIFESNIINTSWYTLDGGLNNYNFSGLNGTINQSAWDTANYGVVHLRFYVNDSIGNTGFKEVEILKDFNLTTRRAYAIIVGVSNYPGTANDLMYCRSDAITMHSLLRSQYNFLSGNMILLTDSQATRGAIFDAFTTIKNQMSSEDIFFFSFSGHGGEAPSLLHFICPYDSIPSDPNKYIFDLELDLLLDQLPCEEKIVLIDACNSGGFISEVQASNRFIMTACQASQLSWETSELRHGVFSFFFYDSIFVASDSNSDGVRSLEEQYSYASSETTIYMLGYGELQQPSKYDGISGSTVLFPSIGSLSLNPIENELHFSFNLYGHGLLKGLKISVCSVYPNISSKEFDLKFYSPSTTGFGYYSDVIKLDEGFDVSGYEIRAEIEGYNLISIVETFGDTDDDGLYDLLEISNGIDPSLNDTDGDGLSDYDEYYGITDPLLGDTDGDGMPDGYEVNNGLNPISDDSLLDLDGDGLNNIIEYTIGTYVNNPDTDNDGMNDGYEYNNELNLFNDDANLDYDNDGLENILEYQLGSIANNADSDNDSMPDGWEYDNGLDLLNDDANLDPDDDGLLNMEEYHNNTDPHVSDTDGDGWSDGDEVKRGTDPTDPDDYPRTSNTSIPGYLLFPLGCLILLYIVIFLKKLKLKVSL